VEAAFLPAIKSINKTSMRVIITIPSGKIIPAFSWAARLAKSIGSIGIVYSYVDININFLILSVIGTSCSEYCVSVL
jgi:hypothetical protein